MPSCQGHAPDNDQFPDDLCALLFGSQQTIPPPDGPQHSPLQEAPRRRGVCTSERGPLQNGEGHTHVAMRNALAAPSGTSMP